MNHNIRAHVRAESQMVILSLGDTTIAATLNSRNEAVAKVAKKVLAGYEAIAERINAEIDATGRMDVSRALEIMRDVITERRLGMDDGPWPPPPPPSRRPQEVSP